MGNEIFSKDEFITLGFEELKGDKLDDGGSYKWWRKAFDEITLDITYEYDKNKQFVTSVVELCGQELSNDISRNEVLSLGRILFKSVEKNKTSHL